MQIAKQWPPFHQPGGLAHLPFGGVSVMANPGERGLAKKSETHEVSSKTPARPRSKEPPMGQPGQQSDVALAFVNIATVNCGPFLSQSPVHILIKRGLASDLQNKWAVPLIAPCLFSGPWRGDSPLE